MTVVGGEAKRARSKKHLGSSNDITLLVQALVTDDIIGMSGRQSVSTVGLS